MIFSKIILDMDNIIFGVYNGYSDLKTEKGGLYYFIKSLRKVNKTCKVVVICESDKIFPGLREFSEEMDFEIYSDFETKYFMIYYRFEIYLKYLKEYEEKLESNKINKILLADMNDVIFQNDPFEIQFQTDLYCALECNNLRDSPVNYSSYLNMSWINGCSHLPGFKSENFTDQYVACAGTILGTYSGIKNYLDFYINAQSIQKVNDQGLYNMYVYSIAPSKTTLYYKDSAILTLDRVEFKNLKLDNDGFILNSKSERYSIIHQIDRCNLPFMLNIVEQTNDINKMKILYRISDGGNNKIKPNYVNDKERMFLHFLNRFNEYEIYVFADNVKDETYSKIMNHVNNHENFNISVNRISLGNSKSFLHCVNYAISNFKESDKIYFAEDDYIYKKEAPEIIEDGLLISDYVSGYDHPDKYMNHNEGGPNPFIENGGEQTRVLISKTHHWKITNSCCMTFATTVKTIKEDYSIFDYYCKDNIPHDFRIFTDLYKYKNRKLISALPAVSTHGEIQWLSPFIDWESEFKKFLINAE